jgi:hypothetical protein
MTREFREGQHILVEQLIETEQERPVPPGRYVIVEVIHDLLGKSHFRIRSLPDEDIEAEVDSGTLSEVARKEEG